MEFSNIILKKCHRRQQRRPKSFSMSGCAAISAVAASSSLGLGNENSSIFPSKSRSLSRSHKFRKTICLGLVYGFVRDKFSFRDLEG